MGLIAQLIGAIVLAARAHAAWPEEPLDRVLVASYVACRSETHAVPKEILMAVAQHESDLQCRAVSWRRPGEPRVDIVAPSRWNAPVGPLACGLVQSVAADRASCERLLDPARAMAAGVAELQEELRLCRGIWPCALSIYAGGHAGLEAWTAGADTDATRFAYYFIAQARRLGWRS